jgi:hypothetical protein
MGDRGCAALGRVAVAVDLREEQDRVAMTLAGLAERVSTAAAIEDRGDARDRRLAGERQRVGGCDEERVSVADIRRQVRDPLVVALRIERGYLASGPGAAPQRA